MKPEAALSLAYARKLLSDAAKMQLAGLPDHAARTAYLACFHAARAFVFQRTGRTGKTHSGVQHEFHRLTKDDARIDAELRAFLSRSYNY